MSACPACAVARAQVEPLEARVAELEATLAIVERLHAEALAQLRAREAHDAHLRELIARPALADGPCSNPWCHGPHHATVCLVPDPSEGPEEPEP